MNNALNAKTSPKNAYAAPQLKVYGAMQKLTASGMSGRSENESFFGCKVAPRISFCTSRRP